MSTQAAESHRTNAQGEIRLPTVRTTVRSSEGIHIMALISFTRVVRISAVLFTLTMLMATPALAH